MWLFKPSIQLAYAIRSQYALPKTASIQAAKVLFKLLGPSEEPADLKRFGFFVLHLPTTSDVAFLASWTNTQVFRKRNTYSIP